MEQQVKELIVERLFLDLDPNEIQTDEALAEYGVDSFLLLELIVGLEEMFRVKFDNRDINPDTLRSVRSLCDIIKAKQG